MLLEAAAGGAEKFVEGFAEALKHFVGVYLAEMESLRSTQWCGRLPALKRMRRPFDRLVNCAGINCEL